MYHTAPTAVWFEVVWGNSRGGSTESPEGAGLLAGWFAGGVLAAIVWITMLSVLASSSGDAIACFPWLRGPTRRSSGRFKAALTESAATATAGESVAAVDDNERGLSGI